MSYVIRAVIARAEHLRHRAAGEMEMVVVDLAQGFGLMPTTEALCQRLHLPDGDRLGFEWLPAGYGATFASWSLDGSVAFVEAELFGGFGTQRSAVWSAGATALGPLGLDEDEPFPLAGSPISQALRQLGVECGDAHDEFDAVGLGRHRDIEGWMRDANPGSR
jgi:hypothetical protein